MLGRTAGNLYWLARYLERMDYVARLLEVAQRMAALTTSGAIDGNEWHSALIAAGCEPDFLATHDAITPEAVMRFLVLEPANPSSIWSCIETGRINARAVRSALTVEAWEAINGSWLERDSVLKQGPVHERLGQIIDWVKMRSILFRGAYASTMLRNDAYHFTRLGNFIERADNTARILDVKYHVLLPQHENVGGGLDYYQWTAILRAASALRAYHWVFNDRVQPWKVADLLILHAEMPRSLSACYQEIVEVLDKLATAYGGRIGECHRLAGEFHAKLRFGRIEVIFESGLHEFLSETVDHVMELGQQIAVFYLMD
ncbi:MAG: alpha-E domain-containing protein [Alphaproteobacteria bacterium]